MTIDEAIEYIKISAPRGGRGQGRRFIVQLVELLEEFKVYKKALQLACEDVRCANPEAKNCDKCPLSFNSNCFSTNTKIDYYLNKARENHEQKAQENL